MTDQRKPEPITLLAIVNPDDPHLFTVVATKHADADKLRDDVRTDMTGDVQALDPSDFPAEVVNVLRVQFALAPKADHPVVVVGTTDGDGGWATWHPESPAPPVPAPLL